MTEQELIEIEARAAAATPGPWEQVNKSVRVAGLATTYAPNGYSGGICNCLGSMRAIRNKEIDDQARDNAAFIASARLDIPALLAEVRRLLVELDELQGAWAKYPDFDLERLEDGRYEASAFEGKDPLGNRNAWAIGATPLEAVRALAVQWERVK